MGPFESLFEFIIGHQNEIYSQTIEHIGLTGVALAIATTIGLPTGLILTRQKKSAGSVLGAIGVIQTIPSIALLGFLIPLLGIGAIPAIVALFLYALLPIVRNVYTGIEEVDESIKEAARGMGMTDRQILTKVELPLAVPVIFAGIRTATVINVGVATLCALIGAGGLGQFIFRGIALNNVNMIIAGAIPAAALALCFDFILGRTQKHIKKIIKPVLILAGILVFVVIPFILIPSLTTHPFRAGFTAEFMERPDGYPGLKKEYGLTLDTVELDPGLMYKAIREKKVDIISGFSTDGRIKAYNLRVLEDDKNYFPPYYAAPLILGETLRKYPFLRDVFSELEGQFSTQTMRKLNYQVDHHKKDPSQVARNYLNQLGYEKLERKKGEADLVIGSKNFTEQFILAHVFAFLIEQNTPLNVNLKTGLGGTKICFDSLINGEIDLYPEYTGTGLLVILDEDVSKTLLQNKDLVYREIKEKFKECYDLVWLPPLGFNNTYALMMREKQAVDLGIRSISDLKRYLEEKK